MRDGWWRGRGNFQKKRGNWKDAALAGLATALALVLGSIAFAFVAGVSPISGLSAEFIVCLITAALPVAGSNVSGE